MLNLKHFLCPVLDSLSKVRQVEISIDDDCGGGHRELLPHQPLLVPGVELLQVGGAQPLLLHPASRHDPWLEYAGVAPDIPDGKRA